MEPIKGLFDGTNVLLKDHTEIPLTEIKKVRIEIEPYLLFPVCQETVSGSFIDIDTQIIYPYTVEKNVDKHQLVYGKKRQTRIMHYIAYGSNEIRRKPDLRRSHTVQLIGYRHVTLELKNRKEITVDFDGNCIIMPEEAIQLNDGQEIKPLVEFYDRPSELINVFKKAQIEVYAK